MTRSASCFVNKLTKRLVELGADGVNVDVEELAPEDSEPLLELLVDLKNALHARGMRLTVDVAFYDPAYDLEFIGQVADAVFVMGYDQHYPASKPGPVSGRKWFSRVRAGCAHAREGRPPRGRHRCLLLRLGRRRERSARREPLLP